LRVSKVYATFSQRPPGADEKPADAEDDRDAGYLAGGDGKLS